MNSLHLLIIITVLSSVKSEILDWYLEYKIELPSGSEFNYFFNIR